MGLLQNIRRRFFASDLEKTLMQWQKADGDNTYRLSYEELNEDSVVFDLGGYKGEWTGQIFSMFGCCIFVFEPVSTFFHQIRERFKRNKKINVFSFGLGNKNIQQTIYLHAEASSVHRKNGVPEIITIKNFESFLQENNINKIDLLKINIEGGEYDLLEFLIEKNLIRKIKNIQVQFHNFVPDAVRRMANIQQALSATHTPTYQYKFIWENWKLKQ
jgi:FkbM family methyltransferase